MVEAILVLSLHAVAQAPETLAELTVPQLAAIIAAASAEVLAKSGAPPDEDRLITVAEAAEITGLSVDAIKRRKRSLGFVRQVSPHKLMASLVACKRYREGLRHRG